MKVYRVFAPIHGIVKAGTIEMGIFSDRPTARDRLMRLVLEMETESGAEAEWHGEDAVSVRINKRDTTIRILEYMLDDPSAKSILTEMTGASVLATRPGKAHLN